MPKPGPPLSSGVTQPRRDALGGVDPSLSSGRRRSRRPDGEETDNRGCLRRLESEVRSYCRSWPSVSDRAASARLWDTAGRSYLDFFSGAGTLNCGHNHPVVKQALLGYLAEDRIIHSLDMHTEAKRQFSRRSARRCCCPARSTTRRSSPARPAPTRWKRRSSWPAR